MKPYKAGIEPASATTPAEYVALLRRLKAWSGRTYRELEAKAREHGAVLPHSTLATMLNRGTLPREELVAALVRACGCGPETVASWVEARRRIAAATQATALADPGFPGAPPAGARPGRGHDRVGPRRGIERRFPTRDGRGPRRGGDEGTARSRRRPDRVVATVPGALPPAGGVPDRRHGDRLRGGDRPGRRPRPTRGLRRVPGRGARQRGHPVWPTGARSLPAPRGPFGAVPLRATGTGLGRGLPGHQAAREGAFPSMGLEVLQQFQAPGPVAGATPDSNRPTVWASDWILA
jgi:hypothetical protein